MKCSAIRSSTCRRCFRIERDYLPISIVLTPGEAHDLILWPSGTAIPACCSVTAAMTAIACDRMPATGAPSRRYRPSAAGRCSTASASAFMSCAPASSASSTASKTVVASPPCYDHTAASFLGFALLGCIRLWIRFVHAAWHGWYRVCDLGETDPNRSSIGRRVRCPAIDRL